MVFARLASSLTKTSARSSHAPPSLRMTHRQFVRCEQKTDVQTPRKRGGRPYRVCSHFHCRGGEIACNLVAACRLTSGRPYRCGIKFHTYPDSVMRSEQKTTPPIWIRFAHQTTSPDKGRRTVYCTFGSNRIALPKRQTATVCCRTASNLVCLPLSGEVAFS